MQKKIFSYVILFALLSAGLISCQDDYEDPTKNSTIIGTRSGVSIRAIALDDFPALDTLGNTWDSIFGIDSFGRPDIYFTLNDEPDTSGYPGFEQPFQFEDVDRDSLGVTPLAYYLTNEYRVKEFGSNIRFDIYDFEKDPVTSHIDSATLMKSFIFSITPGDTLNSNPYPDSLVLSEDGYSARIFLNWIK